jgi:hypothetical protein
VSSDPEVDEERDALRGGGAGGELRGGAVQGAAVEGDVLAARGTAEPGNGTAGAAEAVKSRRHGSAQNERRRPTVSEVRDLWRRELRGLWGIQATALHVRAVEAFWQGCWIDAAGISATAWADRRTKHTYQNRSMRRPGLTVGRPPEGSVHEESGRYSIRRLEGVTRGAEACRETGRQMSASTISGRAWSQLLA